MTLPVLLDTDLGSDVDDELALALLWGSPELDVAGVCTSYGDTVLRARIALRMAQLTGRTLSVAAGETETRSGTPVWWGGHEGDAYGDLGDAPVDSGGTPSAGVRLLAERADGAALLAIGPLTSVAAALDAGVGPGLASLTLMGGEWADPDATEHNIRSDVAAARRVFDSGLPITAVGIDITQQVHFSAAEADRFAAAGPLGEIIAAEMRAWMKRWDEDFEVPHDPLAALVLVAPELFTFSPEGRATVSDGSDGRPEGALSHQPGEGRVRFVTAVDVEAATEQLAERIVRGVRAVGGAA
ncbi:MAG: hypothetical protein QOC59_252 [Microbacteriaceae bacterium]|nr:hypothetical protein [Microbacteriaceae bacterium]